MTAIQGLHIEEERPLAGKLAGALYLTGSATGLSLFLVPGIDVTNTAALLAVIVVGIAWGTAALTVVPWDKAPPIVSHLSCFMGLPIAAVAMASTGGATSPTRFYLLFIIFYASYFYVPREAALYIVGCAIVHSLPLFYESGATEAGFVGELLVIVPTYFVLGALIIAAKRLQVEMRERADALALSDPLTGVANRRAFEAVMDLGRTGGRASDRIGLLLVDLDDFKSANTLFGHTGGDGVLCAAADALREAARGNDLVARLGGDEFAILATGISREATERLAQRVLEKIAAADRELGLAGFRLSASVGWATHPDPVEDRTELYRRADMALGEVKAGGKAAWRAADPSVAPAAEGRERQATSRSLPVSTS
ncbi:MAG TPA: GGDEF domain-containing protein [Thermoleophilaceae bacterium]|nr:GGDEF domain-containing protein [Thermoleophilaceae bacterium]